MLFATPLLIGCNPHNFGLNRWMINLSAVRMGFLLFSRFLLKKTFQRGRDFSALRNFSVVGRLALSTVL